MPTKNNPYESPPNASSEAEPDLKPAPRQTLVPELSEESRANIGLTSKLVKIAAAFAALASLTAILQILAMLRFYGVPNGWTTWHTIVCLRILFTPCWLLLAWMLWKFGVSLDALQAKGICNTEPMIEQQAKLWLSIGLMMFVMLLGFAAMSASSMIGIAPQ